MSVCAKRFVMGLMLIVTALSGPCEKSYHQRNEDDYLVAVNINLLCLQDARAGLMDAATQMDFQADVAGPNSYDPQTELADFKKIVAQHRLCRACPLFGH